MHAEMHNLVETRVRAAIDKFQPKAARQFDEVKDIEGMMADAVKLKFLDAPLTKDQIAEFIQIPKPGS